MKGLIEQYNALGAQRKTLIRKALATQAGSGEALIPEKLEKIITNTVVRLSPEMAVIQPEFDNQKLHSFNRLMKLPRAGGFMGEGATTPTSQGSYERASVELKILRRKGAVTNFLQDTSKKYIDASTAEMKTTCRHMSMISSMLSSLVMQDLTNSVLMVWTRSSKQTVLTKHVVA